MVCLDTTFVVDLLRGRVEVERVIEGLDKSNEDIFIAAPSVMEIISGAELEKSGKEKEKALALFSRLVILSFDKESAILAGEIEAFLVLAGEAIEDKDIMIGAIAKSNREKLLTKNVKHFQRIRGLEVEGY